jgi:hypothetical protein
MFEFELEEDANLVNNGSKKRKTEEWEEEDETVKLFYKLVAHTGFIPIADPTQDGEVNEDHNQEKDSDDGDAENIPVSSFTPSQTSEHATDHFVSDTASPHNSDDNTIPSLIRSTPSPTPPTHPSAGEQFASARRRARRVVYDLRFLRPERQFGPFIFNRKADTERSSGSSRGSLGSRSRDVNYSDEDDTDSTYSDTESNSDSGEDDPGDDLLFPLVNLINMLPNTDAAPEPTPTGDDQPFSPHSLKPDWAWLAGARIIVEANLRDMLRRAPNINPDTDGAESDRRVLEEVGNALRRMEGLRMGGAPGFWRDWGVTDGSADTDAGDEVDDKRKSKDQENGEGKEQGWDWAGVEGTWR